MVVFLCVQHEKTIIISMIKMRKGENKIWLNILKVKFNHGRLYSWIRRDNSYLTLYCIVSVWLSRFLPARSTSGF